MFHPALGFLATVLGARLDKARSEEGASAVEWVVIAAVLVAICGTVAAILMGALEGKAGDIGSQIEGA
ncbi:Flp family type IVb pilin [Aeromicrobium sp. 179-A 4D2 NHS]|uniref:Flp family type IVb pilin n=1 Tax=Aeromicrobium sp. 179-A 4D2 NHS TaxID=3142375 RepID=UPI0039A18C35